MGDLVLQRPGGALHGLDHRQHVGQVLLQHLEPIWHGRIPFAAKPGEGLHLPDGHAGLAQAQQESDPFHVRRRIAALAAGCAVDGRDQPCALVVAQGVCGQSGALCDLGDGEMGCHGTDPKSWSAL